MTGIILDEAAQVYRKDGKTYARLTSILKDLGIVQYYDGPGRDFYLTRGQFVHKATDLFDRGKLDEKSIDPILSPFLDGWIQFRQDSGFIPTEIEEPYVSEAYHFACRPDRIGIYQGKPAICEIKSGTMLPSVRLQLSGQRIAVGNPDLLRIGVELPGKRLPDGKRYRKEVFIGGMDDEIFRCAVAVYHYKHTYLALK